MALVQFLKTLWGCFTVWHLKGTDDFTGADCIITHGGGWTKDGRPGLINEFLTKVVCQIVDRAGNLPIIAQGELGKCLSGLNVIDMTLTQKESDEAKLPYVDTIGVAKIHKADCKWNGWKHPILVSYHPHLWRGMMVARKLGMEVIIPEIKSGVYDPECSQWWMRSPWFNTPRELACRLLWLLQGKI